MIPSKIIKKEHSGYFIKRTKKFNKCWICQELTHALLGNPSSLLKRLKVNSKNCECHTIISVSLFKKRNNRLERIGNVELVPSWKNNKFNHTSLETHSWLENSEHGRGLGVWMYVAAADWCMENGYKLSSSRCPSELAQRVWKSKTFRKYYRITKIGQRRWKVNEQRDNFRSYSRSSSSRY